MEINTLEVLIAGLWTAGVAAGFWLCLASRSARSLLLLGAAVVVPVLGSMLALVVARGRFRSLRQSR